MKTFGDNKEFELEIQRPLDDDEKTLFGEKPDESAHDDDSETQEIEDPAEASRSIHNDFYALPPLDPDLEEILHAGNDDVEIKA
ncbi:unnamed protein product [Strongylus vulgaris]|uniref:Uncharacterized protein n=1 Tax=Strongylus vulgaris TaxID=40348 RepID=A0A3P7JBM3_STRVU|nr:unnamed protein product [Strongylus vulgaris]